MYLKEHAPQMRHPFREGWRHQFGRRAPGGFGDLLQQRALRRPLRVGLRKPELVPGELDQCGLEGSKKVATFPIAALIWSRSHGNSAITCSAASGL